MTQRTELSSTLNMTSRPSFAEIYPYFNHDTLFATITFMVEVQYTVRIPLRQQLSILYSEDN